MATTVTMLQSLSTYNNGDIIEYAGNHAYSVADAVATSWVADGLAVFGRYHNRRYFHRWGKWSYHTRY